MEVVEAIRELRYQCMIRNMIIAVMAFIVGAFGPVWFGAWGGFIAMLGNTFYWWDKAEALLLRPVVEVETTPYRK